MLVDPVILNNNVVNAQRVIIGYGMKNNPIYESGIDYQVNCFCADFFQLFAEAGGIQRTESL